ncbi:MAG: carboxypeptidase regulatory-like domain-containing protein [Planctomycetes bacterium]|nr:carboxypeptidase regulatory-like domain-containing protein [Planctomycetota bacterium]
MGISNPHESTYVDIRAAGYASQRVALSLTRGIVHEGVSVELGLGYRAVGTVSDQLGNPVANAKIGVFGLRTPSILTDANGLFKVEGLDPSELSYSVSATHASFPYTSVNLPSVAAGETAYVEITMKQGATVYGQVVDSYGVPIEGTTVGTTMSGCMVNCVEDQTDPNGMYRLENVEWGELVIWVSGGRHAPYVWFGNLSPYQPAERIDIQIPKSRIIRGKVIDQAGQPVAGASISMDEYQGVDCLGCDRVKSDSEGIFVIENAPTEGDLKLSVFGNGVSGLSHTVDFTKDERTITVQRSGSIYGRVIDDTSNQPIREFKVNLSFSVVGKSIGGFRMSWFREGHRFSSAEGFFDTESTNLLLHGQVQVTVAADGYDRLTLDPVNIVPRSRNLDRLEFRLRPATALLGRIMDPNGVPLPAANVHLLSDMNSRHRERWQTTTSGQAGQFLFPMTGSEPQCLYITAQSYTSYLSDVVDITDDEAGSLIVVMEPSQRVYGRVTDESGRGIPNARLFASVDMPWISDSFRSAAFRPDIRAETDAEGFYELSDLPLGRILLQALTNDGKYNVGREVELFAGKDLEVNFDPREPPSE